MSNPEFPCKGCTKRYLGCHSECELYNNCKTKHDEKIQAIRAEKMLTSAADSYHFESLYKKKKRRRTG